MNEYNLDKSKLVLDPFPHMIEDNFLSETLINNLVLNFPDEVFESFDNHSKRTNININHPRFKIFLKNNKDWKKLKKILTNKKFISQIIDILKPSFKKFELNVNLERFYTYLSHNYEKENMTLFERISHSLSTYFFKIRNYFLRILKIPSLRIDFQCARSKSGYSLVPHTDQRSKIIVILFYLNDMIDDQGKDISNLDLFKNKSNDSADWVRHPKEDEVSKFKSISIRKNKFLLMLNSKNSYHGVNKFNSENYRKFIYLSLSITNFKNIWN